jgi:tripeptidyl-peptidase-1
MIFSATMRLDVASVILGALAVPAFALTLPSSSSISHIVHEKRDSSIQRKWVPSAVDHSHILPARIGLKQSNLDLGARYLDEM